MKHSFEKYCKNYQGIENYEKALKDNFKGWHCHHRLETHNSDGERRLVNISTAELKALGMYYNRPAEELIFLTTREHNAFNKGENNPMYGKKHCDEARRKIAEARKGEKHPMYGKRHSEETKNKIAEAMKGHPVSEGAKKKMREAKKGKHWYTNGKIIKFCYECPDGFVPGRFIK